MTRVKGSPGNVPPREMGPVTSGMEERGDSERKSGSERTVRTLSGGGGTPRRFR